MKNIALIGCSKKKQGVNCPNKFFNASEIYLGNSFKKAKNTGVNMFRCDDYYIISAEHHLLDKNDKILYYDKTLNKMSPKEREKWADIVLSQLKKIFDLTKVTFYIFAGKNYYENLCKHLNCVVFKYKNSNCITFDIKEKFNNGGK